MKKIVREDFNPDTKVIDYGLNINTNTDIHSHIC